MKGQSGGIAPRLIGGPEGACDQMGAGVAGHPVADNPAGEEIEDNAEVEPVVVDLKVGDVADPDLVGAVCGEMLLQQVLLFVLLTLLVLLLCLWTDAVQIQFLHDCHDAFGADPDTALGQCDADLFGTKDRTVIKGLLHQPHELFLFPVAFTGVGPPENVIVEGAAGNIQRFTELVNAIRIVRLLVEALQEGQLFL